MLSSTAGLETWFITSLVHAGQCSTHCADTRSPRSLSTFRRPYIFTACLPLRKLGYFRQCHTKSFEAAKAEDVPIEPNQIEEEEHIGPKTHGTKEGYINSSSIRVRKEEGEPPPKLKLVGEEEGILSKPASTAETSQTLPRWTIKRKALHFQPNLSREELMGLVDQYNGGPSTDQPPAIEPVLVPPPDDDEQVVLSSEAPRHHARPADLETATKLDKLEIALQDWHNDPEVIYRLYRDLPEPRAQYIEDDVRHKLLRHLSVVDSKDEFSMLRYFSVVDDVKVAGISLSITEWNSALSFAARYVAVSTEVEVEAALTMWKEMEHVAGVKGNEVTFNVLYDVACKAGKFTLAEMIYKELHKRGFQYNRYHHVSIIFACGLRKDGDGARAAYKALVEAGEMVDTVVLTSMISALLGAGEPTAAESIYEKMKKIHTKRSGTYLPPWDFKDKRIINSRLLKWAKICQNHPDRLEQFQNRTIIAPDIRTYRVLIHYSAVRCGDLEKTSRLLSEMSVFKIPLHGALFLTLFKGFALHGGIRYTKWDTPRLESVWKAFNKALDSDVEGLYISKWMVNWVLAAFAKCSGKSRTITIWEEIKEKWEPEEAELDFVMIGLRRILEDEEKYTVEKRRDWVLGE